MRYLKFSVIVIFVMFIAFFSLYESPGASLQGEWDATAIVLDGKEVYASENKEHMFSLRPTVVVRNRVDSLYVIGNGYDLKARFTFSKNDGDDQLELQSRETSLNGTFDVSIDSTMVNPRTLRIEVKLKSRKTLLQFRRDVHIKPFRPELPRKGQV